MRLTQQEQDVIRQVINISDQNAKVYVFGSRIDDTAKGGDIDLLVISDLLTIDDKISIKLALYKHLGEQKIDLVFAKKK